MVRNLFMIVGNHKLDTNGLQVDTFTNISRYGDNIEAQIANMDASWYQSTLEFNGRLDCLFDAVSIIMIH